MPQDLNKRLTMIELKKGDFIYSDADITGYSGSISRRYKVVEVYEDKLHKKMIQAIITTLKNV